MHAYTAFWLEIVNERYNAEDIDMNGTLILKLILKIYIQELSHGLISLKIGENSGFVLSSTEIIRMVKSSGLSRTGKGRLCPVSKHWPLSVGIANHDVTTQEGISLQEVISYVPT